MSPTSRTSALTHIRLVSGTLQTYPGLRLTQQILVVLNLLYQNLQKSGYVKTQQMVPLNLKINHNLPICLIGDLNSHTGTLDDTLPIEQSIISNGGLEDFAQELFDITPTYDTAIMSEERYNKDTTLNNNGQLLIDFCKVSNMKIVNGRLGSDKGVGDFTYRHATGNSTIDYCVVTPNLVPHIKNFNVDFSISNF